MGGDIACLDINLPIIYHDVTDLWSQLTSSCLIFSARGRERDKPSALGGSLPSGGKDAPVVSAKPKPSDAFKFSDSFGDDSLLPDESSSSQAARKAVAEAAVVGSTGSRQPEPSRQSDGRNRSGRLSYGVMYILYRCAREEDPS